MNRSDQTKRGLIGLLVGDALGVPHEFHEPYEINHLRSKVNHVINFTAQTYMTESQ